ncbi:uncharacterized protein LOC142229553 [Haematobia irritans]|uniref:uncharacterized protein LOC142229553 n=1 Tax=Haematobia irritans TaxID=7368 RepID=UPI003F505027
MAMKSYFMAYLRQRDMKIKKHFNILEEIFQETLDLKSKENSVSYTSIELQMKISCLKIQLDSILQLLTEVLKKLIELDIKLLELKSNYEQRNVPIILAMKHDYQNFLEHRIGELVSFEERIDEHFITVYCGLHNAYVMDYFSLYSLLFSDNKY